MKTKTIFTIITPLIFVLILSGCVTENKAILNKFKSGKSSVLVCPVHILTTHESLYDTIIQLKIADYINNNNYAIAKTTTLLPPPNNRWRHNEAKMLTESCELLIEFVKQQNLPDNTFVLYPEFYKAGPNEIIVAVHYSLLDNNGKVAMRGLINSHWTEFQKVNPKTNEDCLAVFINGFEEKMKRK
jgi:hypothetical protein